MTNARQVDELLSDAPPTSTVELSRVVQSLRSRLFGVTTPKVSIGRYEVVRRLGVGVHGEVFEGLDRDLSRRVAIKVLARGAGERHYREARATASLVHPNVVEVFTVGVHNSRPYVAMSFIDGPSLSEWDHDSQDAATRLGVVLGAARGLAAAHSVGLLHGDIKPANVLIDATGVAKVADFGNATWIDDNHAGADIVGTPGYIAPEAYEGVRSEAADQFGLAATAWEVLGGVAPFAGSSEAELRDGATRAQLSRPRRRDLPASTFRVLQRGMSPNPHKRWPSVTALADALTAASRPRPRWPWIAAVSLGGLAAGLAFHADDDHCRGAASDAAAVWSASRAAQLERVLEPSSPVAADVMPNLRARLDDWTFAWTRARTEACADAADDETQRCLDARLVELDETLRILQDDPSALRHALGLVRAPAAGFPCPTAPSRGSDEAARHVRRLTARADVLHRVGRGVEAMEAADEALARAREHRDPRLVLEASVVRAAVLTLEDPAHARELLENAAWRALGMGRVDIAAAAAVDLSASEPSAEQQLVWAERAIQWSSDGTPHEQLAALDVKADALFMLGRHQEAIDLVDKAWDAAQGHPAWQFHLMLTRGNAKQGLGDVEGSLRDLVEVRELARDHFGRFHPSYGTALNELAIAYAHAGDEDKARTLYLEVVELFERLESPNRTNFGRALLNVGLSSRHDNPVDALAWFDRAEQVFADLGEDGAVDLARVEASRAYALTVLDDAPAAVSHARSAVDILTARLPEDHPLYGYVRSLLADACQEIDEAERPAACSR